MSLVDESFEVGTHSSGTNSNLDMSGFRHVGDEHVYQGHIWRVVSGSFIAPDGELFRRDIVRSPGAVAVVPVLEVGTSLFEVVMLRQYRAAFDDYVLEIPAGMRDVAGEPPLATAERELLEETGYRAGSFELLHTFYPSPGMTDAILHVYLGRSLVLEARTGHGPEEMDMEIIQLPIHDAVEMAVAGHIRDAKSVIGLLLAQRVLALS